MHTAHLILIAEIVYALLVLGVIIKVIKDTSNSVKALGYILVVIFFPVGGIILYFSVGVNYRKQKLYKKKLIKDIQLFDKIKHEIFDYSYRQLDDNYQSIDHFEYTVKMLLHDSLSPLSQAHSLKLLINGEQKFEEVFKALEAAKNHIHIQYYIFSDDEVGNKIKDILIRKAQEGVEVRFIFDDFGSHDLHKKMLAQLRVGGVKVAAFYRIRLFALASRINYRNHRKIIVIDGNIGFVGGINVDDKYINNGKNKLFWRDTHLMLEGLAVWGLQYTFLNDWNFCSDENLEIKEEHFIIKDKGFIKDTDALVQVAVSGPDSPRASIMLSCLGIIMECRKRLYITTPYFIPNDTVIDAMKYAALSGVDVRLLVPGKSDSLIVNAASCSNYGGLLDAGVRIYRYTKGFVHAKTIVADDSLAVVGSANMDMRSFDLNFEINALVFSKSINEELCNAFMDDIKHSVEIKHEDWIKRSRWRKYSEAMARLFSPLL